MAADGAATPMAASDEQAKLDFFLAWLNVNGAQLRGCGIKYCDSTKGYGVFASDGGDCTDEETIAVIVLRQSEGFGEEVT